MQYSGAFCAARVAGDHRSRDRNATVLTRNLTQDTQVAEHVLARSCAARERAVADGADVEPRGVVDDAVLAEAAGLCEGAVALVALVAALARVDSAMLRVVARVRERLGTVLTAERAVELVALFVLVKLVLPGEGLGADVAFVHLHVRVREYVLLHSERTRNRSPADAALANLSVVL